MSWLKLDFRIWCLFRLFVLLHILPTISLETILFCYQASKSIIFGHAPHDQGSGMIDWRWPMPMVNFFSLILESTPHSTVLITKTVQYLSSHTLLYDVLLTCSMCIYKVLKFDDHFYVNNNKICWNKLWI